jgi:hypothetical protein
MTEAPQYRRDIHRSGRMPLHSFSVRRFSSLEQVPLHLCLLQLDRQAEDVQIRRIRRIAKLARSRIA